MYIEISNGQRIAEKRLVNECVTGLYNGRRDGSARNYVIALYGGYGLREITHLILNDEETARDNWQGMGPNKYLKEVFQEVKEAVNLERAFLEGDREKLNELRRPI